MNGQLNRIAVIAITKNGVALAKNLSHEMEHTDIFYKRKYAQEMEEKEGFIPFDGSVSELIPTLFQNYKGLVFVFSLGAVIRLIAPYIKDKKTDPAVVVVDEQGEYAISVLSGHLGGANDLAKRVAKILQAHPVITTASDRQNTIAVDLLGRSFGWTWESPENLTSVSAAVVNGEDVAIIQESGETNWWQGDGPMPDNLKVFSSLSEALDTNPTTAIFISHRLINEEERLPQNLIIYRPKVIVLGIGCNRGTSKEEIEAVITETLLHELHYSMKSVKAICTIDLKKDEVGLLQTAEKNGWEFRYYKPKELNSVRIEAPSNTVYKYTGAYGVSEPAAKLYSGADTLSLVKKKSGNVTISVAVIPF